MTAAQYPKRTITLDSTIVAEPDDTGLTTKVLTRYWVSNIVDTGVYLECATLTHPFFVDWERIVANWRILVIRKGRSKKPGRSWEMVERWYLHRILIPRSITTLPFQKGDRVQIRAGVLAGLEAEVDSAWRQPVWSTDPPNKSLRGKEEKLFVAVKCNGGIFTFMGVTDKDMTLISRRPRGE